MKRTPLKAKRDRPRRNEGRITHERIKPKAKAIASGVEKVHLDRIGSMPCIICGDLSEIHHIMHGIPEKIRRRDHRFVVPVCAKCHRGDAGIHGLGSERKFNERYGINIAQWAKEEWQRTLEGCSGVR